MTPKPKELEDRATVLIARRAELLIRLPRKIKGGARLRDADRELVIDEAITYAVMQHARPIADARELERVFWIACDIFTRRMLEGRHDIVRAGWTRVSDDVLIDVANGTDPLVALERSEELKLVREFAATLDAQQQRVLRVKYFSGTSEPLGFRKIARQLGITLAAARSADRAIKRKLEQFAAVYTAGELCPTRKLAISALASGRADQAQAQVAQAHVAHCQHCHESYLRQLRAIRSTAFERKVAALLPPVELEDRGRRLRGAWDAVADILTRPFTHEGAASTAAQLAASGAGRGAGTIALLKIAGVCMASAGALGVCATTIVAPALRDDPPARKANSKPARTNTTPARRLDDRPRYGATYVAPTPTPTPTRTRKRAQPKPKRAARARNAQRATGPSGHEQTPASPAPANAAPAGQSEFDPTYQPSTPPAPAPAPAAPGATEFF